MMTGWTSQLNRANQSAAVYKQGEPYHVNTQTQESMKVDNATSLLGEYQMIIVICYITNCH